MIALPSLGMASGEAVTRKAFDVGHSRIGSHAGGRCTHAHTETRQPDGRCGRLGGVRYQGATKVSLGHIAAQGPSGVAL